MNGAEELRTAAAALRARATAARRGTPTPWTPGDPADPELYWIALMDPGMGPLLADWLDGAARTCDATVTAAGRVWPLPCDESEAFIQEQAPHTALAVARAINSKEH